MTRFIVLVVLIVSLVFTVSPLVTAAPQALFDMHQGEGAKTSAHDFFNGTHLAQYGYFISIQNMDDDSNTILGDITYALDADNIIEYNQKGFANKTGSFIRWTFPPNITLSENTFIYSEAKTGFIYPRYFPITIHRWTNRSVFSSDGYQRAFFSLSFDNFSLEDADFTVDNVWGGIAAYGNSDVNVSLLPDTFTTTMEVPDNPMAAINNHSYSFSNESPLEVNHVYNFSVVLHVQRKNPSGPAIEYYPGFSTALMGGKYRIDPVPGFTATMPADLLPRYAHAANGSTNVSNNWTYMLDYTRSAGLNESIKQVGTHPPVSNFTATPRSGTAPLNVRFIDTSTNSPTSWKWTFGDGSAVNSTQKNPVHTYSKAGRYNVSLRATNAAGNSTATKIRYITVTAPVPVVNGITPSSGVRGRLAVISNLSGTAFSTGARVYLNKTGYPLINATNVSVVSAKRITCTFPIPAGAPPGLRNVDVKYASGTLASKANGFMVRAPVAPVISGIQPATGMQGTLVTITNLSGAGFIGTPKPVVQLTRGSAVVKGTNVTVINPKKITCTFRIPAMAAVGFWNVTVINGDNQKGTKESAFYVTPPVPPTTIIPYPTWPWIEQA